MKKHIHIFWAAALGLASCFLFKSVSAGTEAANLTLESVGWSVKASHNFVSNPPSLDAVQAFVRRAYGSDPNQNVDRVCAFRFADLRHSGNLSLVVSIDGGGTSGCNSSSIFDKTATGLEIYTSWAMFYGDDDIQDINHNGKQELILWSPVASADEIGEECEWPMVYAWTGDGYAESSGQYREYHKRYLKSLNEQIAAYSSRVAQASPAAGQPREAVAPIEGRGLDTYARPPGGEVPLPQSDPSSAQITEAAPTPNPADYACQMVQAAKTEQLLGIRTDTEVTAAAIKDSESDASGNRMLAAVLFSIMKTPETIADLKTLANDADTEVAKTAKSRLDNYVIKPSDHILEIKKESVWWPTPGL
jgi:hypothetical protein